MNMLLGTLRAAAKVGEVLAPNGTASSAARLFFTPRKRSSKVRMDRVPLEEGLLPTGYFRRWSEGKPVFMLHGWEGTYQQFRDMIAVLEQRGFGAITLDPLAHGAAEGRRADPRSFADTLLAAQERLGAPIGAIGHSLGGLALMLALRDGLASRAVVLVSSPSSPHVPIRQFEDLLGLGERTRSQLRSIIAARVGEDHVSMHARQLLKSSRPRGLIVHDDDDPRIPASHAGEIASAWPGASVMRTKGYGHSRILNPAVAEEVADWLQTTAVEPKAAE